MLLYVCVSDIKQSRRPGNEAKLADGAGQHLAYRYYYIDIPTHFLVELS